MTLSLRWQSSFPEYSASGETYMDWRERKGTPIQQSHQPGDQWGDRYDHQLTHIFSSPSSNAFLPVQAYRSFVSISLPSFTFLSPPGLLFLTTRFHCLSGCHLCPPVLHTAKLQVGVVQVVIVPRFLFSFLSFFGEK